MSKSSKKQGNAASLFLHFQALTRLKMAAHPCTVGNAE